MLTKIVYKKCCENEAVKKTICFVKKIGKKYLGRKSIWSEKYFLRGNLNLIGVGNDLNK